MRWIRVAARIWTVLLAGCLALLLGALSLRGLAPRLAAAAEVTVTLTPASGSDEVAPDSRPTLTFSAPMNRLATLQALQLVPAADGSWQWSADGRSLTFVPRTSLASATTYAIKLAATAQTRWWQLLGTDRQFVVSTATRPTVRALLPPRDAADGTAPLALTFDQPMIDASLIGTAADTSAVRLSPPTALNGRWLDRTTLLLTPQRPLSPAAAYQLEVTPALRDARGIALAAPFRGEFTTAWPTPLSASAAAQLTADGVLTVTFAAQLDPATVRRALRSSPDSELLVSSSQLEAGRLFTITARDGWRPATRYRIDWQLPAGSTAPLPIWQFETTANPGLIAAFPGSDQPLQPGEELRLTFATPMESSALQAGLSIEPAAPLELTVIGTGVRLRPTLAAATVYTLTIAAGTRDRNGTPLAEPIVLNVRAGNSLPSAEWLGGTTLSFSTGQTPTVLVRSVNIDTVTLDLYRLDDAGLVRAVEALADADSGAFIPERIGLQPLLSREFPIPAERDRVTLTTLPLSADGGGATLPTGAYWLIGRTAGGTSLQRLVLISDLSLYAAANGASLLVVVQDRNGTPLAGIPLRVYERRSLLLSGTSDEQGVLTAALPRPPTAALTVVSGDGQAAAVRLSVRAAPELQLISVAAQSELAAGDRLQIAGLLLQKLPDGSRTATSVPCRLTLIDAAAAVQRGERCTISDDGQLSAELRFSRFAAPGTYRARLTAGTALQEFRVRIVDSGALQISGRETTAAGLTLRLTRRGRPAAGEPFSYSITLTPTAVLSGELQFGADGPAVERSGNQRSDSFGRLVLPLDLPEYFGQFDYRLTLRSSDVDAGEPLLLSGSVTAGSDRIGIAAPRLTAVREPFSVAVQTTAADGSARSGSFNLDIRRNDGTLIVSRLVTTAADGAAAVNIPGLAGGTYRIVARRGTAVSSLDLTVSAPDTGAGDSFRLLTDRSRYRVGDSLRLAVSTPRSPTQLLITFSRGAVLERHRFTVSNGSIIELPLGPALAPGVRLEALLSSGTERWTYGLDLEISGEPPALELRADSVEGLPGRTVALEFAAARGSLLSLLIPADTLLPDPSVLTVRPAELRSAGGAAAVPAPLAALLRGAQLIAIERLDGPSTVLQQVTLPEHAGNYVAAAYLFTDDGQTVLVRQPLRSRLPLELVFLAPRELRAGDETLIRAVVRTTTPGVAAAVIDLTVRGAELLSPPRVSAVPAADGLIEVSWRIRARAQLQPISLEARSADGGPLLGRLQLTTVNDEDARLGRTRLISETTVLTLTGGSDLLIAPTPAALLRHWQQRLTQQASARTDQLALQLLLSALAQQESAGADRELPQLRADLQAELIGRQQRDGGWAALPGRPADPLSTLIALDVLLELGDTSLAPPRALRYLTAVEATLTPDLLAYAAALRARSGEPFTLPAADQLSDVGLALAVTAGGSDSDRYTTAAERRYRAWLAGSPLTSTLTANGWDAAALLAQALQQQRKAVIDVEAITRLLSPAGPQGLPDPFSTLQIARTLTLTAAWPAGQYQSSLNGRPLLTADSSAAQRARFAAGTLVITTTRPLLLSSTDSPAAAAAPGLPAWQLFDRDGAVQALDSLRAGENYRLEQLLILAEPATRSELYLPLPAGLNVSAAAIDGPFNIELRDSALVVSGADLPAGVYRLTADVSAVHSGRYHVGNTVLLQQPTAMLSGPAPAIVIIRSQ
jgi:alpha-2-macroglobulin